MVPVNPHPSNPPLDTWGQNCQLSHVERGKTKKVLLDKICFCQAGFHGTGKMFRNLSMFVPFFFPLSPVNLSVVPAVARQALTVCTAEYMQRESGHSINKCIVFPSTLKPAHSGPKKGLRDVPE